MLLIFKIPLGYYEILLVFEYVINYPLIILKYRF